MTDSWGPPCRLGPRSSAPFAPPVQRPCHSSYSRLNFSSAGFRRRGSQASAAGGVSLRRSCFWGKSLAALSLRPVEFGTDAPGVFALLRRVSNGLAPAPLHPLKQHCVTLTGRRPKERAGPSAKALAIRYTCFWSNNAPMKFKVDQSKYLSICSWKYFLKYFNILGLQTGRNLS